MPLVSLLVNRPRVLRVAFVASLIALAPPSVARAQLFETIGIRAQGMAGAFVAVADDATATWWNPAGLATGAYFNGIVEHSRAQDPRDEGAVGVSLAYPALGLSYYRLHLPSFVLSQFGATVGQSLGDHLVVGSTVKLVRADRTRGDLDLGAMATFGPARLAVAVRHIGAPEVNTDRNPMELERQVRVGAAYSSPMRGGAAVMMAIDADLTRTTTIEGDARHLAGGLEMWFRQRVGVRGGMSMNTVRDARRAVSAGVSVATRAGLFVDGRLTSGNDESKKGWGFALRVTF